MTTVLLRVLWAVHGRSWTDDAMPAVRRDDGNAWSGPRRAVEGGSVLGLSALRAAFLDDLPAATPNAL